MAKLHVHGSILLEERRDLSEGCGYVLARAMEDGQVLTRRVYGSRDLGAATWKVCGPRIPAKLLRFLVRTQKLAAVLQKILANPIHFRELKSVGTMAQEICLDDETKDFWGYTTK